MGAIREHLDRQTTYPVGQGSLLRVSAKVFEVDDHDFQGGSRSYENDLQHCQGYDNPDPFLCYGKVGSSGGIGQLPVPQ